MRDYIGLYNIGFRVYGLGSKLLTEGSFEGLYMELLSRILRGMPGV